MGYWEGVRRRWEAMIDGPATPQPPPKGTGTGHSGTGDGLGPEWKLVYDKFRQINGRDPYSVQELIDWWNNA